MSSCQESYGRRPEKVKGINQYEVLGRDRLLLPMASVGDIATVPGELLAKFQTSFYSDPVDAVFKAVGVE